MNDTKRLIALLFGWVILLGMGGCAIKEVTPPTTRYVLNESTPGLVTLMLAQPRFDRLEITTLAPNRESGSLQIFYRLPDHTMTAYAYHRWTETPARMLARKITLALLNTHTVSTPILPGSGATAPWRLEWQPLVWYQDFTATPSKVRTIIQATLLDNEHGKVVASRLFRVDLPAPSDDAPGGVEAFNRAADRLVADLVTWLQHVPLPSERQRALPRTDQR